MEKDLLIEQLAAKIEDLKKKKIEESQKSVSSKESQTHPSTLLHNTSSTLCL